MVATWVKMNSETLVYNYCWRVSLFLGLTLLSKCMMSFAIEPQKTSEPRPGMDMMGSMTEKQKDQHMLIMYDLSNQM